jgi:hypothetical protein
LLGVVITAIATVITTVTLIAIQIGMIITIVPRIVITGSNQEGTAIGVTRVMAIPIILIATVANEITVHPTVATAKTVAKTTVISPTDIFRPVVQQGEVTKHPKDS